jgi:SAM-dependent methyltransferase
MWAAEVAMQAPPGPILDICCGAGQIGLLAAKVSERDVLLVDGSPRAIAYAERNAATAELQGYAAVRCGPIEEVVPAAATFPIIVADLSRDLSAGEARRGELWLARRVLRIVERHLATGGSTILQVGRSSQADGVTQALLEGPAPALRVADIEVYRHGILLEVAHLR